MPQTAETMPRRLELLVGLAQALAATGRLEQALGALDDGLALVGPELAPVRARLVAGCAMCENLLGRHAAAHARLLGALAELGEEGSFAAADLEVELAADALYDSDFAGVRVVGAARARHRVGDRRRGVRGGRHRARVLRRAREGEIEAAQALPRTPPRGSTRSTTARSRAASTPPTTSGSPSSSASTTKTRSVTSAAASRSPARRARVSS